MATIWPTPNTGGLAIFSIICFSPFLDLAFVPRGAAASRAFEANTLHGGGRRLSVRAVKAAGFAFIGAKRRTLTGEAEGSGAEFSQEGYWKDVSTHLSIYMVYGQSSALDGEECDATLTQFRRMLGTILKAERNNGEDELFEPVWPACEGERSG